MNSIHGKAQKEIFLARATLMANVLLSAGAVLCILALVYFAYHYGWTGSRQFTSWQGGCFYYGLPAVTGAALLLSLRMERKRKVSLALFCVTAGISIYMVEIVLSVWFGMPSVIQSSQRKAIAAAAKSSRVGFDTRSKLEVVDDLSRQGVESSLSLSPHDILLKSRDHSLKSLLKTPDSELLPLAGMANRRVVLCNEGGQYVIYTSDRYGFNNPSGLWDYPKIDIAAVGDSFVQGYCVEQSFITEIRKHYPSTLNLGIEGDGPLSMLAKIREYAGTLKPKIVLWFFFEGNDLGDLEMEAKSPILRRYLKSGFTQNLPSRQPEIDRALTNYVQKAREESRIRRGLKEATAAFSAIPDKIRDLLILSQIRERLGLIYGISREDSAETHEISSHEAELNLLDVILREAKAYTARWGGQLCIVYLPVYDRYVFHGTGDYQYRKVLTIANAAGIPVIDIPRAFESQADPLSLFPFRMTAHYNERGHRIVADEILRHISLAKLQLSGSMMGSTQTDLESKALP